MPESRRFLEAALISLIVLSLFFIPQYFRERWYGPMMPSYTPPVGFFEVNGRSLSSAGRCTTSEYPGKRGMTGFSKLGGPA